MPSAVIPCLRYRNAPAAIDFLCAVLGFERHLVVPGPEGTIAHAQLTLGEGMIMLGSVKDDEFDKLASLPRSTETQCPYVVVADADATYGRAKDAGWEIVIPLSSPEYGGRLFTCRDPGGHSWNIGTYDPWH
jgi:uncharacterized glyoxalase superfamily protein PhnB